MVLTSARTVVITLSTPTVALSDRAKAITNRLLGDTHQWTRITDEQTPRLPHGILQMITAHLTRDLRTLKACSLTCRSWYIIVVPHLHHTLTLSWERPCFNRRGKKKRPSAHHKLKPLPELHNLGLIPLVKKIRVEQRVERWNDIHPWLVPRAFTRRDLRYFSAFANVQVLVLQRLQIYCFIPGIGRYFEHFSPTLQSIGLHDPCCTPKQLSHFLSLFSNLDDIEIHQATIFIPDKAVRDTELVPFSAPKLRGRLTLVNFHWAETWTNLVNSCGGLWFRHMDLYRSTECIPVLMEACAGTLETLRFGVREKGRYVGKQFCRCPFVDLS